LKPHRPTLSGTTVQDLSTRHGKGADLPAEQV